MLKENLTAINDRIALACASAHRSPTDVTMIAVTKSVDSETAKDLAALGIRQMAENRVDQLLEKKAALENFSSIQWHLIGNLQRRKVKLIINDIDYFHALDSLKLAAEIQKRALKPIACFVEVNISGEATKHGLVPEELIAFIEELANFNLIKVVGLMMMAPKGASEADLHQLFAKLKQLQTNVAAQNLSHAPCQELSMGMSDDYPVAIEEGATFIRIGSAIFK